MKSTDMDNPLDVLSDKECDSKTLAQPLSTFKENTELGGKRSKENSDLSNSIEKAASDTRKRMWELMAMISNCNMQHLRIE